MVVSPNFCSTHRAANIVQAAVFLSIGSYRALMPRGLVIFSVISLYFIPVRTTISSGLNMDSMRSIVFWSRVFPRPSSMKGLGLAFELSGQKPKSFPPASIIPIIGMFTFLWTSTTYGVITISTLLFMDIPPGVGLSAKGLVPA